jgi:hypothetical protein
MQHLKRRPQKLLEDLQILNTSPIHKTKRAQEKKINDSRIRMSVGASVAYRWLTGRSGGAPDPESTTIGSRAADRPDGSFCVIVA